MENFDLEKLERKNIYAVPPGFFEAMQSRVMEDTVGKGTVVSEPKSGKILPLKWYYAAAAAIVFLLGFGFILNQNPEQAEVVPVIAKAEPLPVVENHTEAIPINEPLIAAVPATSDPMKKLPVVQPMKPRRMTKIETPVLAKKEDTKAEIVLLSEEEPAYLSKEELTEQIISELSGQEIAELAKNTEQDVYLELFN